MKCNGYLGIVSIILIIGILILVYYKNMKDNNIEGFYQNLDDIISSNNLLSIK